MSKTDCSYLVAFVVCTVGFCLFIISFVTPNWITHGDGRIGLWRDCFKNHSVSSKTEKCNANATADGPAFLEITRGLLCVALVLHIMGSVGYNFIAPISHPTSCKEHIVARLQDLCYFAAGILGAIGCVFYGMNYHSFYADKEELHDVKLSHSFYLSSISAGLCIAFSIVLTCSRETGLGGQLRERKGKLELLKSRKNQLDAGNRKDWLQNKNRPTPTPAEQKKEVVDVNDEVEVKRSTLATIVTPVNVILAFNRLKSGKGRNKEKKEIDQQTKEIEALEFNDKAKSIKTGGKYKGIFTIDVDNRGQFTPPPTARLPNPNLRKVSIPDENFTDSDSSTEEFTPSSTLTSDNDELRVTAADGAVIPRAEKSVIANGNDCKSSEEATEPKHGAKGGVEFRNVKRSVTTLQGNNTSHDWAVDPNTEIKGTRQKPKRHYSHQPKRDPQVRRANPAPFSPPAMNIYNIPTDTTHPEGVPPPMYEYEEVVGKGHHGNAPEPIMTEQSKIYQPYSKR